MAPKTDSPPQSRVYLVKGGYFTLIQVIAALIGLEQDEELQIRRIW